MRKKGGKHQGVRYNNPKLVLFKNHHRIEGPVKKKKRNIQAVAWLSTPNILTFPYQMHQCGTNKCLHSIMAYLAWTIFRHPVTTITLDLFKLVTSVQQCFNHEIIDPSAPSNINLDQTISLFPQFQQGFI